MRINNDIREEQSIRNPYEWRSEDGQWSMAEKHSWTWAYFYDATVVTCMVLKEQTERKRKQEIHKNNNNNHIKRLQVN